MSGIVLPLRNFPKKLKKKKPAPLARRQSFNGDVKPSGQPPSPLVQASRKKVKVDDLQSNFQSYNKSASLSSLLVNDENGTDSLSDFPIKQDYTRQDILDMQKDIQHFIVCTTKLKESLDEWTAGGDESGLNLQSVAEERIDELNHAVNNMLSSYPEINSNGIRNSLAILTERLKSWEQAAEDVTWCKHCQDALEGLNEAFSQSVEGYVCEPQQVPSSSSSSTKGFVSPTASFKHSTNMVKSSHTRSAENLAYRSTEQQDRELMADIDKALLCTESAVDVAVVNSKTRTKYMREITTYMNKRAAIVADYYRQISKLNKHVRDVVSDLATESDDSLPLLGLFQQCLDEDVNYARTYNNTFNFHVSQKFVEPIEKQTAECMKLRKELKDTWSREQKKLSECKAAMKASKSKYTMLGQELSRLKAIQMHKDEVGHKQEKRKKEISDIQTKREEAETTYKRAVDDANDCQYQVHVSQKSILCAFRRMVMDSDQSLKANFEHHFAMQCNFFEQFPHRFMALQTQVSGFEPGRDFYQYVIRRPQLKEEPKEFVFQEFDPNGDLLAPKVGSTNDLVEHDGVEFHASTDSGLHSETDSPMLSRRLGSPISAWETCQTPSHTGHSPQHSTASSSNVSITATSPGTLAETQSLSQQQQQQQQLPKVVRRQGQRKASRPMSMANILDHQCLSSETQSSSGCSQRRISADMQDPNNNTNNKPFGNSAINPVMSKVAHTHRFKKAVDPTKCRECDNNVYFHGVECEVCGLICHQKCLEFLMIKCGNKKLQRKLRTFGVDFQKYLETTHCNIPIIVTKCINELDERGLDVRGIYRLSGAKTKMDRLCRLFEAGGDRVELSDQSPHQIAACLKLYLRELPEPLLTHALYSDFISCAKDAGNTLPLKAEEEDEEGKEEAMVLRLQDLLTKLDPSHYLTMARLLFHLHRVHQHHRCNCMPASNLGIVFGPNLLQPKETQSSYLALKEMTYQAKAIELLIYYTDRLLTNITEEQVKQEEFIEEDTGTVEAYIPIESSDNVYNDNLEDERLETRTTISDAFGSLDDSRCNNYRLFDSNMEELLHSLYHSARQRLDQPPMLPKSKSASPDQILDNDEYDEDQCDDASIILPGSVVGSDQESLLSLQHTPTRSMLPPVAESRPMEYTDDIENGESDNKNVGLPTPKLPKQCNIPFSSLHSQSTPVLFGDDNDGNQKNTKSRISVPFIGIVDEDTAISSSQGDVLNSGTEGSDYDEDSQPESDSELFDTSYDVLNMLDSVSSPVSPTHESSRSTPSHKSTTLPTTNARQRKSSSFKRDSAVRQAKRAISLNIPRNKGDVVPRRGSSNDSKYLSSSLLHLHHDLSPSPVSMDRLTTSSVASSYSGSMLNSGNTSPWHTSTSAHRMVSGHHVPTENFDLLEVSGDDTKTLTRNKVLLDDDSPCNDGVTSMDNNVMNGGAHTSSTSGSDGLPDNEKIEGEEKAALEQNVAESTDKRTSLESQIRSEISRVDSIGEKICYIYDNDEPTKPAISNPSSTSEDGVSVHSVELRMEVRSLSPLSENSIEDSLHNNRSIPNHSSSNSTSSTELVFIHRQHGSTASEQSVGSQHKQLHNDTLQIAKNDHVPQSPRTRRLLAITPSLQKLSLSRSTSDVSTEMKSKDKPTASPKTGFRLGLRRKNSLVLQKEQEDESSSSLKREKSKSTTELYAPKGNWRSPFFSGLPRFKKTKSNSRAKQYETAPTATHAGPKPKHKKSRTPKLV
ncbi:rho GTPase-activating protein 45-like isoform X2 [Dysidea avara]|uniref:rho GTPase-activating protein 45-like isoform X2 n=1 Tax=Dysidea avara TaxID=196820 RepID=UPI00332E5FF3